MKKSAKKIKPALSRKEEALLARSLEMPARDYEKLIAPVAPLIDRIFLGKLREYENGEELTPRHDYLFLMVHASPGIIGRYYLHCPWNDLLWIAEGLDQVTAICRAEKKRTSREICEANEYNRTKSLKENN